MAVLSKIISLAVILAAAAVTTEATLERPLARTVNVRRHPARAAHLSPVENAPLAKRASRKKRCAAKTTSSAKPESTSKTTTKAAATTTSSKAATNTGSSSSSSSNSKKAGLGWNNGKSADIGQFTGSGSRIGWCYSWSPWPCNNDDIDFVSMLWGAKQIGDFKSQYDKVKPKYVLSFNEPDLAAQANLSPADAKDLWYEQLNNLDAKLIAPAPSGGKSGREWLTQFMNACSGCNIHAMGIHYYSTDADELIDYVKDVYKEFGRKIWVTEWACMRFPSDTCTSGEASAFNKKVMQFFEETDYVERYAAFGSLKDMYNVGEGARLMSSGGIITDLGAQYAYGGL